MKLKYRNITIAILFISILSITLYSKILEQNRIKNRNFIVNEITQKINSKNFIYAEKLLVDLKKIESSEILTKVENDFKTKKEEYINSKIISIDNSFYEKNFNYENSFKHLSSIKDLISKEDYLILELKLNEVKKLFENLDSQNFNKAEDSLIKIKKYLSSNNYLKLKNKFDSIVKEKLNFIKNEIVEKDKFINKSEKLKKLSKLLKKDLYNKLIYEINLEEKKYVKNMLKDIDESIVNNNYSDAKSKIEEISFLLSKKDISKYNNKIIKMKKAYDLKVQKENEELSERKFKLKLAVRNAFYIGGCVSTKKYYTDIYTLKSYPILIGKILDGNSRTIEVRVDKISNRYTDKFYIGQNITFMREELFNIPCNIEIYSVIDFLYEAGYTLDDLISITN